MNQLSIIPLGGVGDVTRNMYVYEMDNEILLVDCGIGFANQEMLGVDLLLPDITYLQQTKKKIVGLCLTHGHEDHIGALPFILPQLPEFPLFATPLTAALANEKLKEFGVSNRVQTVTFEAPEKQLGNFRVSFIRVTHSVPDTSHIFIKTPVGNFYHGSDFKFDLTPADGKKTDFTKIAEAGKLGIRCVTSDCLGAERPGSTPSEISLGENIEDAIRDCSGKVIVTTYSSNISRLNQVVHIAERTGRQVSFIGRSLLKAKDVAQRLGYLQIKKGAEIEQERLHTVSDKHLMLIVAGSQGQENSAMTRIANDEHKDIHLTKNDIVIFSSDPIPGNELAVSQLIDTIAKAGATAVSSDFKSQFHVSGHGYSYDLMLLMALTKPKQLMPIGGNYHHMVAYRKLANKMGYDDGNVLLIEDGQEIVFTKNEVKPGRKIPIHNVFVDQVSGEEVESFVLRDRQKIAKEGVVVVMLQMDIETGQIAEKPDLLIRGFFVDPKQTAKLAEIIERELQGQIGKKKGRITDWAYLRKLISDSAEKRFFRELKRRPLILPILIEV